MLIICISNEITFLRIIIADSLPFKPCFFFRTISKLVSRNKVLERSAKDDLIKDNRSV